MKFKIAKFKSIFFFGVLIPLSLHAEQNAVDPEVPEVIVIKVPVNDQNAEVDQDVVLHVCQFDTATQQLEQVKSEDLYALCDQEENKSEQFLISEIKVTPDKQVPEPIKNAIEAWKPEEQKCNKVCQNMFMLDYPPYGWSIYTPYGSYGRGIYGYGYIGPYGVPYGRPYYNRYGRYYSYRQPYVYPTYPRYYYYNGSNHYRYVPYSGVPRYYGGNNYYYYRRF